jgi:hypothetical protein
MAAPDLFTSPYESWLTPIGLCLLVAGLGGLLTLNTIEIRRRNR